MLSQNKSSYFIQERVPDWEALIHTSVFHLCPRGNGPSSYRLYESLQADTIPIYIWDEVRDGGLDIPGIPALASFSFSTPAGEVVRPVQLRGDFSIDIVA